MAPPPDSLYARGFAADAETERSLRTGLAGREVKIQRGRLPVALRILAAEPSPRLVFVDIDGVSDPEAAARELASVCAIGTALIAVGSTDTAPPRPFAAAGMESPTTWSSPCRRQWCGTRVRPLWTTCPSGPTRGASSPSPEPPAAASPPLVAETARGVKADGRSVLVVNLDPISHSLSALLGAGEGAGNLATVLAALDSGDGLDPEEDAAHSEATISPEQLDSIRAAAGPGISLIAYPRTGPLPPSPPANVASAFLRHLANQAHVVLVAGIVDPDTRIEIMRQADARVLLYEPTLLSISATVHCLALLGADCPSTLVQCHARMRKSALSSAQIRYALAERRPRHRHSLRAGIACGRTRREARPPSGQGVSRGSASSVGTHRQGPGPHRLLNTTVHPAKRRSGCGHGDARLPYGTGSGFRRATGPSVFAIPTRGRPPDASAVPHATASPPRRCRVPSGSGSL